MMAKIPAKIPAIVFTDLDGTLLDHHSYSFEPARPALERLSDLAVPIVIVTSKTIDEVARLRELLGNQSPYIVENGAALVLPAGYPGSEAEQRLPDGSHIRLFSLPYETLRDKIKAWRAEYGFKLEGFGDMDVADVARYTGLDAEQSRLAKQRIGSEPFLWHDTKENLALLQRLVEESQLRCVQGGRFYHLMGQTNKARATKELLAIYKDQCQFDPHVIALGDSPNDIPLLQVADVAVVIKKHDDSHMEYTGSNKVIFTEGQGPAGWNQALQQILNQLENNYV